MTSIGQIIKTRRGRLDMSQQRLADLVDVDKRQVGKWENDGAEPSLAKAILLRNALGLTLDQLVAIAPLYDLSGDWCAAWWTTRDGADVIDRHELEAWHDGARVRLVATGGYRWQADLFLEDDDLGGRFWSMEAGYVTRGAVNFQVHPDADRARGDWTGHYVDGYGGSGRGALARDRKTADALLDWLIAHPGPYKENWPDI